MLSEPPSPGDGWEMELLDSGDLERDSGSPEAGLPSGSSGTAVGENSVVTAREDLCI